MHAPPSLLLLAMLWLVPCQGMHSGDNHETRPWRKVKETTAQDKALPLAPQVDTLPLDEQMRFYISGVAANPSSSSSSSCQWELPRPWRDTDLQDHQRGSWTWKGLSAEEKKAAKKAKIHARRAANLPYRNRKRGGQRRAEWFPPQLPHDPRESWNDY